MAVRTVIQRSFLYVIPPSLQTACLRMGNSIAIKISHLRRASSPFCFALSTVLIIDSGEFDNADMINIKNYLFWYDVRPECIGDSPFDLTM